MGRRADGTSFGAVIALLAGVWLLGKCSGESNRVEPQAPIPTAVLHAAAPTQSSAPRSTPSETRYVDAESLNYRASPNGALLGRLSRGTQISVLEREGGWMKVSVGVSRTAWIAEKHTCSTTGCWRRTTTRSAKASVTRITPSRVASEGYSSGCPCSGTTNCYGPRGGRYCITSGGNKRYR